MGSGTGSKVSREDRKAQLKARRQEIAEEIKRVTENNLNADSTFKTDEAMQEYFRLRDQLADTTYEYEKLLGPMSEERMLKMERATDLAPAEVNVARADMLRNKAIYKAISDAAAGVASGQNTALDDIYQGKNKNISASKLYDNFANTRKALRKKYGDTITLYRAEKYASRRTLVNYTTQRANAVKYQELQGRGSTIKAVQVPIKDIVAVNVSRGGKYEEIIVRNQRR